MDSDEPIATAYGVLAVAAVRDGNLVEGIELNLKAAELGDFNGYTRAGYSYSLYYFPFWPEVDAVITMTKLSL